jgi:hypothetical protein
MESSREAGEMFAPRGARLAHVNYRHRDDAGWPRNTLQMTFSDGSTWRSPHGPAQTFNVIARVSKLGRCLECLDATAEFSDLSVCDPWIRDDAGHWKYKEPEGWSGIIVRTETGQDIVDAAVAGGRLDVKQIAPEEIEAGQHQMMTEKKEGVALRLRVRRLLGWPNPVYRVNLPMTRGSVIRHEIGFWIMRIIPRFRFLRRLLLRVGFSRVGSYFIGRRMRMREKRVATQASATSRDKSKKH